MDTQGFLIFLEVFDEDGYTAEHSGEKIESSLVFAVNEIPSEPCVARNWKLMDRSYAG